MAEPSYCLVHHDLLNGHLVLTDSFLDVLQIAAMWYILIIYHVLFICKMEDAVMKQQCVQNQFNRSRQQNCILVEIQISLKPLSFNKYVSVSRVMSHIGILFVRLFYFRLDKYLVRFLMWNKSRM